MWAERHAQFTRIVNDDWFSVGGGDGFVALVDPTDPNVLYAESQGAG